MRIVPRKDLLKFFPVIHLFIVKISTGACQSVRQNASALNSQKAFIKVSRWLFDVCLKHGSSFSPSAIDLEGRIGEFAQDLQFSVFFKRHKVQG